ncbi:MAG TPA: NAD(P)-dependent oxidoreductase [Vicinamibacterales bacterium]|nr:NAD(P)-dependent oxidoreductase [Vicinamibacterales bacterium]
MAATLVTTRELEPLAGATVLVTGAGGMLGSAVADALMSLVTECRIIASARGDLDVRDRTAVLAMRSAAPDFIVHCAAYTSADGCEAARETCREVQVQGTLNVAELAAVCGAQVVYPQSVFIFDGREVPVTETTSPAPLSEYGRAKLDAEQRLLDRRPDSLVVRMAGFFGGDHRDKNFVGYFTRDLFDGLQRGAKTWRVGTRIWQPTYTRDLAENTLLLMALQRSGLYHMGSEGEATFLDVAHACVTDLGLEGRVTLERLPTGDRSRLEVAPRPERLITACLRLSREGLNRQRPWRDALREYLSRPYFRELAQTALASAP